MYVDGKRQMDEWMDGWHNFEWMNEMDGWMNEVDGWKNE